MKRGKITKKLDRYNFEIRLHDSDFIVNATISKTMKIYDNKELNIDDAVLVEMSPNDSSRARIHRKTFAS